MSYRDQLIAKGFSPEDAGSHGLTRTPSERTGQALFQFLSEFRETRGREPSEAEFDALCDFSTEYGRQQHQLVTEFKATHGGRSPTVEEYDALCQQARALAEQQQKKE